MIERYSSRRGSLYCDLLQKKLENAVSYDRIAGYFSSSILEIAGEAIENMAGTIRIVCNSDLDIDDVKTAQLYNQAQKREWCDFKPEEIPAKGNRFKRLYEFLSSGKLQVKVLPKERFGLAHGKAGVITMADGSRTTFLGSVNESYNGWKRNYELVWEDDSEDAIAWVQEEFDALWNDEYAKPLSEMVIKDIERFSKRTVYEKVEDWKCDESSDGAGSVLVESPIYRKSFGLWDHQKYFVNLAFELHKTRDGARLINADQVGLGKTIQLAMSAMLMSLWDNKPVLALVPKTLQKQWRDDMYDLMGIPSAYWNGNGWIDEIDHYYCMSIDHCPRRIGIVSQGIIVNGSSSCKELQTALLRKDYACVIVDECHRARRRNNQPDQVNDKPQMNKLYAYLCKISRHTHSMLLATATPVQMNPVEAWDLLNILSCGCNGDPNIGNSVLGTIGSNWRTLSKVQEGLDIVSGNSSQLSPELAWDWIRNPLPYSIGNGALFPLIRQKTAMTDDSVLCTTNYQDLSGMLRQKIKMDNKGNNLLRMNNPYINHIIRRQRDYLEENINPVTGLPYLEKINVQLYGEEKDESIPLDGYLAKAYQQAEDFCSLLKQRCRAAGLFKTLLLRRIGSSIIAGYKTGLMMINGWHLSEDEEDWDDGDDEYSVKDIKNLTKEETAILNTYVETLKLALESGDNAEIADPKWQKIVDILDNGVKNETRPWKEYGCILFSQYLDTAQWVALNLSKRYENEPVGLYAGGNSSRLFRDGVEEIIDKNDLKAMVKNREVRLLVGTDAASEGLNLQTLGSLINIDLPWNPTRLEQRKGRIQRIGQANPVVYIYNMKYAGSVEERVHELLSQRLQDIHAMFGQIPDVLEDVWIDIATGAEEDARKLIDSMPRTNPFAIKYNQTVENVDWESCTKVLQPKEVYKEMSKGW